MRTIKDPEFSHIKKLLESTNQDDVLIGLILLRKEEFTSEELHKSFPQAATPDWDFKNKSSLVGWLEMGEGTLVINEAWIYANDFRHGDAFKIYFKKLNI